jgi:hypothetical protein
MARTRMPQLYGGEIATGELAHYFDRRFFIKPTCSAAPPVYPGGMDISSSNRTEENL